MGKLDLSGMKLIGVLIIKKNLSDLQTCPAFKSSKPRARVCTLCFVSFPPKPEHFGVCSVDTRTRGKTEKQSCSFIFTWSRLDCALCLILTCSRRRIGGMTLNMKKHSLGFCFNFIAVCEVCDKISLMKWTLKKMENNTQTLPSGCRSFTFAACLISRRGRCLSRLFYDLFHLWKKRSTSNIQNITTQIMNITRQI